MGERIDRARERIDRVKRGARKAVKAGAFMLAGAAAFSGAQEGFLGARVQRSAQGGLQQVAEDVVLGTVGGAFSVARGAGAMTGEAVNYLAGDTEENQK